jgi:hypothetical protein
VLDVGFAEAPHPRRNLGFGCGAGHEHPGKVHFDAVRAARAGEQNALSCSGSTLNGKSITDVDSFVRSTTASSRFT